MVIYIVQNYSDGFIYGAFTDEQTAKAYVDEQADATKWMTIEPIEVQ